MNFSVTHAGSSVTRNDRWRRGGANAVGHVSPSCSRLGAGHPGKFSSAFNEKGNGGTYGVANQVGTEPWAITRDLLPAVTYLCSTPRGVAACEGGKFSSASRNGSATRRVTWPGNVGLGSIPGALKNRSAARMHAENDHAGAYGWRVDSLGYVNPSPSAVRGITDTAMVVMGNGAHLTVNQAPRHSRFDSCGDHQFLSAWCKGSTKRKGARLPFSKGSTPFALTLWPVTQRLESWTVDARGHRFESDQAKTCHPKPSLLCGVAAEFINAPGGRDSVSMARPTRWETAAQPVATPHRSNFHDASISARGVHRMVRREILRRVR